MYLSVSTLSQKTFTEPAYAPTNPVSLLPAQADLDIILARQRHPAHTDVIPGQQPESLCSAACRPVKNIAFQRAAETGAGFLIWVRIHSRPSFYSLLKYIQYPASPFICKQN